ncbi:MAG: nucleoside triphosphate pyrophosphohydrolase family protein [Saprospiraceae bacterium]|nr:nucleoside triphosphate pyrophosphohydrolase family protein [Saprospiraceae bacterium]
MEKFDEPQSLTDVAEFHNTFSLPVLSAPTIPDKRRCELRINLLKEELAELKEAIEDNNLVEIADALADLQYVLSGAVLEFGLGRKFKEIFNEVHGSNMSKTCKSKEEALATQRYYKESKETDSEIVEKDGVYLVYRSYDKKVLKSINYHPADIESILNS